jgi:hypothetical protein
MSVKNNVQDKKEKDNLSYNILAKNVDNAMLVCIQCEVSSILLFFH